MLRGTGGIDPGERAVQCHAMLCQMTYQSFYWTDAT